MYTVYYIELLANYCLFRVMLAFAEGGKLVEFVVSAVFFNDRINSPHSVFSALQFLGVDSDRAINFHAISFFDQVIGFNNITKNTNLLSIQIDFRKLV